LRKTIEEHQNQTTTLEVVKTKDLEKNEELRSTHKIPFSALDKILVIGYEQTKFESHVNTTHEKYQRALEDYDTIIEWQDSLPTISSIETLLSYSSEQRI